MPVKMFAGGHSFPFTVMRIRQFTVSVLALTLLAIAMAFPARAAVPAPDIHPPVGGGILDAGLEAEYFANTTLSGKPAFTRKDIRVRFDWGTVLPVAGSTSPGMKDFPTDGFSVRWHGRVMPRFSETYQLSSTWDEGLRWSIRPTGTQAWTKLVDSWDKPGEKSTAYPMKADTSYDVLIEYRDLTGAANIALRWSSPSTPDELLDCASVNAVAGNSVEATINADYFRCSSPWGARNAKAIKEGTFPLEKWGSDGWYNGDWDTGWVGLGAGRYLLQFQGKATLTTGMSKFLVGDQTLEKTLPSGTGYNPATNLTTAYVEISKPESLNRPDRWKFTATQRDASAAPGTGVRNIRLMRPITPGSSETHQIGEIVNRSHKGWLSNYTNLRFYGSLGENRWDDRTRPGEYDIRASDVLRAESLLSTGGGTGGGNLETYILYANELGRDLYLNVNGHNPSPEYLIKLAQAIRYGTDGTEPYTKPTAKPVYPPLNPNLRIFLEYSNEIWNYWSGDAMTFCKEAVARGNADGKILNYDDRCPPEGDFRRWQALKTVQVSDSFRQVYGDEAMGDRVRILVFGQYDSTRVLPGVLQFIDNYWNNGFIPAGKTTNVPAPHPVNYFIWGGGGATYYSNSNNSGAMPSSPLIDGSFEKINVAPGQLAITPKGGAWTFTGAAGVANIDFPATPNVRAEKATSETATENSWRGFQFTVGDKDIYVTEAGRLVFPSTKEVTSRMRITDEAGLALPNFSAGSIFLRPYQMKNFPATGEYVYKSLTHRLVTGKTMSTVTKLSAGKTYFFFTEEPIGAETFGLHPVQSNPAIRITGAASATFGDARTVPAKIKIEKPGAFALGGGDLHFKVGGFGFEGISGMPPLAEKRTGIDGSKVLVLAPGGSISQVVDFPRADVYALNWVVGDKIDKDQGLPQIDLYLDGEKVGESGRADFPGMADGSSGVFTIKAPGKHTLELRAVPPRYKQVINAPVFMDRVNLASIQAFFGLPGYTTFPYAGDADGEIKKDWSTRNLKAVNMTYSYGLQSSSYEGGWALGGDFIRSPFMTYVNFEAPETAGAEEKMINIWTTLGGGDFQRHYPQVPEGDESDLAHGEDFPLVKAVIKLNQTLPLLPGTPGILPPHINQNGLATPCMLTVENYVFTAGVNTNGELSNNPAGKVKITQLTVLDKPYDPKNQEVVGMHWMTWNIIVPKTADYTFTVNTEAGGEFTLLYRETQVVTKGTAGTPATGTLRLTPGLHTVKLKATAGTFGIQSIVVK